MTMTNCKWSYSHYGQFLVIRFELIKNNLAGLLSLICLTTSNILHNIMLYVYIMHSCDTFGHIAFLYN